MNETSVASAARRRPGIRTVAFLAVLVTGIAAGGLHQLTESGKDSAAGGAQSDPLSAPNAAVRPERAITLEGERIAIRRVQRSVGAVGSFSGYDEVTVAAEVSGRVAKVCHDVGDIVSPGDVLMELDKTDFELELEQTRRSLELELVRLGAKIPPDPPTLEDIAALLRSFDVQGLPSVVRAQKLQEIALSRLQRAESLLQGRAMSEEEGQQRRTEYDVAKAAFDQASYDAEAALAAIRHRAVLLRIAMRRLELATVVVPTPTHREYMPEQVRYAVAGRRVTEGEMLKDAPGSSTATFDLVMDGVLKLEVRIPEVHAAEVELGQRVEIHVDTYPDSVFTGTVGRIHPAVERTSRTFGVQIYVANPERKLKAGGFAEVEILTREDEQAWTVSVESVEKSVGSTRVFVWRDGKAHPILVQTGAEGRDSAQALGWVELIRDSRSELREDDIIIRGGTNGLKMLAEGTPVTIRNAAELARVAAPQSTTR